MAIKSFKVESGKGETYCIYGCTGAREGSSSDELGRVGLQSSYPIENAKDISQSSSLLCLAIVAAHAVQMARLSTSRKAPKQRLQKW